MSGAQTGQIEQTESPAERRRRYFRFFVIVLGAGVMYPLMYLRQNFELSILEAFHITASDLGELYSLLGMVFTLAYVPSGWLADRFSPRVMMTLALATVGVLGLWFSTYPSFTALKIIFLGWGAAGGLLFWASMIKGVKMLATSSEQGRFFGILDGGRGLVEALLASVAVGMFRWMSGPADPGAIRLHPVIYLYSFSCLIFAALIFFMLDDRGAPAPQAKAAAVETRVAGQTLWSDFMLLMRIPHLWVLAGILMAGNQLFWATYSFSAFLQINCGMTALAAGSITLTKLWMRPVGGLSAGILGDKLRKENVLTVLYLLASLAMLAFALLPLSGRMVALTALVLTVGYLIYAIKGLGWALLDLCPVPQRLTGLAIGIICFVGYIPDVTMPLLDGFLSRHFPRDQSLRIYFTLIGASGIAGALLCLLFRHLKQRDAQREA